ncbi:MAG: hypothetical protein RIT26_243 [Pseudomonadota bacterium]
MNLQQLRSVREAVRCGFNLTDVAQLLFTSQPGVSRQIRELEEELGVDIFVRNGKRLTGLTPPGQALLPLVEDILTQSANLRRISSDFSDRTQGKLSIAATHTQARYALPSAVQDFRKLFPDVSLHLHQGSPKQVAEMLLSGEADIGVATEALSHYPQLLALPCYRWTHSLVVPEGHPLLTIDGPVQLTQIAEHPVITYVHGYTGRAHIDAAFESAGLKPHVVLTAMDADVIKTYVELGLGIGIVASIALNPERDEGLRSIEAGHLFQVNQTRLAIARGAWLRGYAYAFIETFAPTLTREAIQAAQSGQMPE